MSPTTTVRTAAETPRERRRVGLAVAVAGLVGVLAAGCTAAESDAPVPDPVPTVDVAVADDELAVAESVPAGRVVLAFENTGEKPHRVVMIPMGADWPPIHQELANDIERPMRIRARIGFLDPGEMATIAVELADGQRYALLDPSEAPDGRQYMDVGVAGEFRAGSADGQASPPSSESPPPSPTATASPAPAE